MSYFGYEGLPLPDLKTITKPKDAKFITAYQHCLALESPGQDNSTTLCHIRLLGHLLSNFPNSAALDQIVEYICSHEGNSARILELGRKFIDVVIHGFQKKCSQSDQTPLDDDEEPLCDDRYDEFAKDLTERLDVLQKHVKVKEFAMMRDEDACMISKDLDLEWFRRHVGLRHLNRPLSPLDAAHIVPEAFFGFASIVDPEYNFPDDLVATMTDTDAEKLVNPAFILTLFGCDAQTFQRGDVHALENILLVEGHYRASFDDLLWWLEPTGIPNRYKCCSGRFSSQTLSLPEEVAFKSSVPTFPLPSAKYLALHAGFARLAYLSGAEGYLSRHEEEAAIEPRAMEYLAALAREEEEEESDEEEDEEEDDEEEEEVRNSDPDTVMPEVMALGSMRNGYAQEMPKLNQKCAQA